METKELAKWINNLYNQYYEYKKEEANRNCQWYKLSFEDFMKFVEEYSK